MLKKNAKQISNELKIPYQQFNLAFNSKGSFISVQKEVRKKVAIELLSLGITPERIFTKTWGYETNPYRHRSRFQKVWQDIFDMPFDDIMNTNWVLYVSKNYNYWIEFLGLERGIDY